MSEREQNPVPDGSVVITPTEMYREMQDIGRKVDKLTSSLDPWQQEMRNAVQHNASRIDVITAERKAADEALNLRVRALETAGYVTSARMWTVVGVLAAVIVAAITAITYLQQA